MILKYTRSLAQKLIFSDILEECSIYTVLGGISLKMFRLDEKAEKSFAIQTRLIRTERFLYNDRQQSPPCITITTQFLSLLGSLANSKNPLVQNFIG